jgi:diguanylate cyclase (GGDEF)-like protein/PAS domain S-box-containing protein
MNREHILSVLYELALTIGGEVRLDALLTKVLQHLLHNSSFPAGIVVLEQEPAESGITGRLAAVVGDHVLAAKLGTILEFPGALLQGKAELIASSELLEALHGGRSYSHYLRLPIDGHGTILLLSPALPNSNFPLTQVFQPVLHNLAKAIQLCRRSEQLTQSLISDRDQARAALAAALEQSERERAFLRNLNDTIPDLVWLKDPHGVYLACNPPFERLYGAKEQDILGKTDYDFVESGMADFFRKNDRAAIANGKPSVNEEWLTFAADGYRGLFETTKVPMWAENDQLIGVLGIAHDITERKAVEERIHRLAHHDALTGLINRVSLQERLEQALLSVQREDKKLAVMLIDQDRFKSINDTLGHHVGDTMLVEIAARLRSCVRESDIVARLGGDEFVVVLTDMEAAIDAAPVARKILHALAQPYMIGDRILHSSASLGIGISPNDGDDVETLMKHADTAMYAAKSHGRNNYQFFTKAMTIAARERMYLERDLREAMISAQFELHYQPKVCTHNSHVCGVEALVRWRHPERGMISPIQFIPLAEEIGLIEALGEWVLDEACRQLAKWRVEGIKTAHMAVNLSAHQLRSPTLVERVGAIMGKHGIQEGELELEVTESAAMDNPEAAIVQLSDLRRLGVKLAIDDFGTGYSSLAYLKRLPIQTLKVDRAFVHDIESDENDAAICAATIVLAHKLGLEVVAEGVETVAQREFLAEHKCNYLQGYLFSRPLPAEEATAFLLKHN